MWLGVGGEEAENRPEPPLTNRISNIGTVSWEGHGSDPIITTDSALGEARRLCVFPTEPYRSGLTGAVSTSLSVTFSTSGRCLWSWGAGWDGGQGGGEGQGAAAPVCRVRKKVGTLTTKYDQIRSVMKYSISLDNTYANYFKTEVTLPPVEQRANNTVTL